ncbi:MAG: hypothetical protein ACK5N0_01855 [Synechococcaceae cyanobacterium]
MAGRLWEPYGFAMAFNLPKKLYSLGCLAAAALLTDGRPAHAILNYYIYEDAGNVIVETAGSLTLSSPVGSIQCGANGAIISPYLLCTGVDTTMERYSLSGPDGFGGTANLFPASNVSGITTGFDGGSGGPQFFAIASGYSNGTPIISSATFNGQSLAGFGFNTPSVVGPWTLTSTNDTINVVIGSAPPAAVPGPLPLLGVGAAFGFSRRLRRRVALRSASKPNV